MELSCALACSFLDFYVSFMRHMFIYLLVPEDLLLKPCKTPSTSYRFSDEVELAAEKPDQTNK